MSDCYLRFPNLSEGHIDFAQLVSDTLNVDSWVLGVGWWPWHRKVSASYARVIGELVHGLSYKFFPTSEQIAEWLGDTAFVVSEHESGGRCRRSFVVSEDGS